MARQPQRGSAHQPGQRRADHAAQRNAKQGRQLQMVQQQQGGVAAHAHEDAVPERNAAQEAADQVPAGAQRPEHERQQQHLQGEGVRHNQRHLRHHGGSAKRYGDRPFRHARGRGIDFLCRHVTTARTGRAADTREPG
ncbi:hypothetical protein G6F22_018462 [Rhizopus arrhizus]|nr:hypothetical protein G6F22_018462 [Rhizopus arrhizus]